MHLMKFDPSTGAEQPYPSHPEQYRHHHGQLAWLFNPYNGERRNALAVGADPFGFLVVDGSPLKAAAPAETLEWSPTLLDGKRVTYDEAEKAVAALGEGWRLPTRRELESIQDLTRHDPCIDTNKFPGTESCAYWSSTPCAWNKAAAVWVVSFSYGSSLDDHRSLFACVRAVRAVPAGQ